MSNTKRVKGNGPQRTARSSSTRHESSTTRKADKAARDAALAKGADNIHKAEQQTADKPRHELEPLEVHPLAKLVPEMSEKEYEEFREDVKQNGLRHPIITTYEGKILDGRHRDRVCRELGIPRKFETYEGDDPAGFVITENVMRRQLQLTDDQRVALITKIRAPQLKAEAQKRMKAGKADPTLKSAEGSEVAQQIAKEAMVGRDKGRQALKVWEAGKIDDVIEKKKSLRETAPVAPTKPRRKLLNGEDACKAFDAEEFKKAFRKYWNGRFQKHWQLLLKNFGAKHRSKVEHEVINNLLGVYDGEDRIVPESVTYPNGKGTYPIEAVVKEGFHFPREKIKPVSSHDLTEAITGRKGGQ